MITIAKFNAAAIGLVSADQIADDTTLGLVKTSGDFTVDAETGVATVATGTGNGRIPRISADNTIYLNHVRLSLNDSGGSIVTGAFGSITTGNGGSIDTTGTGTINFGDAGTRTTITGTATADRVIAFPDLNGTLALTSDFSGYQATSGSLVLDGFSSITGTIEDANIASASTWNDKQSTITFGTGVQTSLGVAIGSAGAPVLFNGAGGTPSSITLTNATGTAASLTAGLVSSIGNLTGDVTSSNRVTTLATVNSNVGSFGSSTAIPIFTVNGKGLITAASTAVVIAPAGTLSGATLASGVTASSLISVGTITSGTWNATVITGQYGGTGVANTGKTITLGGNLTTSGAYAVTLTATGSTNVTLPTTGTLASLAGSETLTNKTLTSPTIGSGLTMTWPSTYSAITLTKGVSGLGANAGEMNELVLSHSNAGANVLAIENTSTTNPCSAITFREGVAHHEKMAIGYLGTGVLSLSDTTYLEINDIDNSGTQTAPAFNLLTTSTYGGAVGLSQYPRLTLATDGRFSLKDRVGTNFLDMGASNGTLTLSPTTLSISCPLTQTANSSATGANRYVHNVGEAWTPGASEGVYQHVVGYFSISSNGSNNITTGSEGGMVANYGVAALAGSGNVSIATCFAPWIRNYGTGTMTQGNGIYIKTPSAGASSPITNMYGLYMEDLKPTGVTNAYAIRSIGTSTNAIIAGKLRLGANTAPTAVLDVTGDIATTSNIVSGGTVRLKGYTVATLPGSPVQGDTAFVTDALAPTFLGTIVGGGAIVTKVFYNGTNWTAQ
jgi:trimeric autotransporter adhesin